MVAFKQPDNPSEDLDWPLCSKLGGTCLLPFASQFLGANILDTLLQFIWHADEGSRLMLQRNRDGFTLQITEAVQRTSMEPPNVEHLLGLTQDLPEPGVKRAAMSRTPKGLKPHNTHPR